MKLGIIGCGAIGTDVAVFADSFEEIQEIFLFDTDENASSQLDEKLKKSSLTSFNTMVKKADVIFEAASQKAVKIYAKKVLEQGKDLIIMSIGSLGSDKLCNELTELAKSHHCKIYLPSGAVCGIDGILSASIDEIDKVTLVTTKPPKAIDKTIEKRTVIFHGSASEAVKKFPKNINVAANLSLAGIGFEKTYVEIVVDPVATRNSHKILAHGRFGRLRAIVENMPNPNNPGTSYLASLSAIATLKRITNPIQIGA